MEQKEINDAVYLHLVQKYEETLDEDGNEPEEEEGPCCWVCGEFMGYGNDEDTCQQCQDDEEEEDEWITPDEMGLEDEDDKHFV